MGSGLAYLSLLLDYEHVSWRPVAAVVPMCTHCASSVCKQKQVAAS